MKKVGIFGSEYQADKQLVIKRLFEKLASLEAEVCLLYTSPSPRD